MAEEDGIKERPGIKGFIVGDKELRTTRRGDPMFKVRVGQRRGERVDGQWVERDPKFFDLVQYGQKALTSYAKFEPGDRFMADGYKHETSYTNDKGEEITGEEWVAYDLGHGAGQNNYVVSRNRRGPAPQHDAAGTELAQDAAGQEAVQQDAVQGAGAAEQVQLTPEQAAQLQAAQVQAAEAGQAPGGQALPGGSQAVQGPPAQASPQAAGMQAGPAGAGEAAGQPDMTAVRQAPAPQQAQQAAAPHERQLAHIPSSGVTQRQEQAAAGHDLSR